MVVWFFLIATEVALIGGLLWLIRRLDVVEEQFEVWRDAVVLPFIQTGQTHLSQWDRRLEILNRQVDRLPDKMGWKGRLALWTVKRAASKSA